MIRVEPGERAPKTYMALAIPGRRPPRKNSHFGVSHPSRCSGRRSGEVQGPSDAAAVQLGLCVAAVLTAGRLGCEGRVCPGSAAVTHAAHCQPSSPSLQLPAHPSPRCALAPMCPSSHRPSLGQSCTIAKSAESRRTGQIFASFAKKIPVWRLVVQQARNRCVALGRWAGSDCQHRPGRCALHAAW